MGEATSIEHIVSAFNTVVQKYLAVIGPVANQVVQKLVSIYFSHISNDDDDSTSKMGNVIMILNTIEDIIESIKDNQESLMAMEPLLGQIFFKVDGSLFGIIQIYIPNFRNL